MKNPFSQSDQNYDGSFLPEDYVARRAEVRANFLALVLFGVVVFSIVAAFFVSNRQWTTVKDQRAIISAEHAQAQQKIEQLKKLDVQKNEMLDKAEITAALIERIPRSVLLSEVVQRMPEGITLLDMKLEGKKAATPRAAPVAPNQARRGTLTRGVQPQAAEKPKIVAPSYVYTVTIIGVTLENKDVTDYLQALGHCDLFEWVKLPHIKERTMNDVDLREFQIKAKISASADARAVQSPEQLQQGLEAVSSKRLSGVDDSEDK